MTPLKWPIRASALVSAALAVTACQTASTPRQTLDINAEVSRIHSQMPISAEPLPSRPVYTPVNGCQYESTLSYQNGGSSKRAFSVRVTPVRAARLLFTLDHQEGTSTLLLGQDGRVYDFNIAHADGSRWTVENYRSQAGNFAAINGWQGDVVNNYLVAFPQYNQQRWQPGTTVATITAENGATWGQMVYRGVGGPNNWRAAIIDIVRPDGQLRGFSIVELSTMLPLVTLLRTQQGLWRLERSGC